MPSKLCTDSELQASSYLAQTYTTFLLRISFALLFPGKFLLILQDKASVLSLLRSTLQFCQEFGCSLPRISLTNLPSTLMATTAHIKLHDNCLCTLEWECSGKGVSLFGTCKLTRKCKTWYIIAKSLSCVQLFVTPWTIQSMELSRPEHWSG